MIFHVMAIKELYKKNYSMDVLFFWLSEEKVRDVLREYKLVALQLSEYKEEKVREYWKIKILINFEWQDIRLLSNADDLEWLAYGLSVIWFDIKNINYAEDTQIEQTKINEIIKTAKNDAEEWIKEQDAKLAKDKENEQEIFDEAKWEKYQVEINKLLANIQKLTLDAKDTLPRDKLKSLFKQWQELSKLKMWRNFERINEELGRAYSKYNDLEQEFLAEQKSSRINVAWSQISDTYVVSEIQKLEKAKWLTKLWSNNAIDVLNAKFWWLVMYLKFLKKDFAAKLKKFPEYFPKMFWDLLFWVVLVNMFTSLFFSICKIAYIDMNKYGYVYVMLIHFWVFWLVLYGINFIKKQTNTFNTILLILWIAISLLLIWVLKQNFIF